MGDSVNFFCRRPSSLLLHARLALAALAAVCLSSAPFRASASSDAPPVAAPAGTQIFDRVPLGREACTIEITNASLVGCAGEALSAHAEVTCGEGTVPVQGPQWFLDGDLIGTGNDVTLTPAAGAHLLVASCGSCEDAIDVFVLDEANCYGPRLDALYARDDLEAAPGIFLERNPSDIASQAFGYLRYRMRPVVLHGNPLVPSGSIILESDGSNLEIYSTSGAEIALPALFDAAALPETLLVNGTAFGTGTLTAAYDGAGAKSAGRDLTPAILRARVGLFPGLAGSTLAAYPFFEFVAAVNGNESLWGALDPGRHPERVGLAYRAYVVAHRTPAEWASQRTLVDVSGGAESATVASNSIANNRVALWTSGLDTGSAVGKAYDVVYDFGMDGRLDPGDLIDGLSAEEAGVHLVKDLSLAGPHTALMIQYSGGTFLGQRTYYPSDIASLGQVPLVVISHGNGHDYTWYDYLGYHLASYGYIVMAHQNNTQPGIETASTTTLTNTDYIIANQATIGGGVLNGHLDGHRIVWIGHSRGGEGVVRAYDRIFDGTYTPARFTLADIVCISSIAPTVYNYPSECNTHLATYHLLFGAADGDVNGGCDDLDRQSLRYAEAAQGTVQVTYVQGASHNDFNCCGWADGTGPNLIGRAEAQRVAKSYYLPLIEYYTQGNVAARDYLTRMYAGFHPSGIAAAVICANTYRDALAADRFMIDDHQTNTGVGTSSSGGAVSGDVSNLYEGRMDDRDSTFTWTASDPMNGMTRSDSPDIYQGGAVFDWTTGQQRSLEYEVVPGHGDLRDFAYVSLRACQGTRHPETVALNGPLSFTVALRDAAGVTSAIATQSYGDITRPYQRTGLGTGAGWANEFHTVRIRLADFENDGSGIDLANIVAVKLEFGSPHGSARGRLGIDDIEFTRK